MKKLIPKLLLVLIPIAVYYLLVYMADPFNVFHYDRIRMTQASSNSNYIKTRYVIENPDRFNAFVVGSSRAGNIPRNGLPTEIDGTSLSWYNLETSMASVMDGTEAINTFLANGVSVKYVLLGIDEISMWKTYEQSAKELMSLPYQEYEKNPVKFFYRYLKVQPNFSVLLKAYNQNSADKETAALYYDYGVQLPNLNTAPPAETGKKLISSLGCAGYSSSEPPAECIAALRELKELCEQNNIRLVVYTSPIHGSTYREAVSKGYFEFLEDAAKVTEYYNFSGINEYTTDQAYYFDNSHFIPYVGLKMEEVIFSNEKNEDVTSFGAYITEQNVSELVQFLKSQIK